MGGTQEESSVPQATLEETGDALVPSQKAKKVIEFARQAEAVDPSAVLVPSRGHKVVEIETEAHREHRRRLRSEGRSLQQSTSAVSPPRGSGNYEITYQQLSTLSPAQEASFTYAAARIGKIITSKFASVSIPPNLDCALAPGVPLPSTVGDMHILVKISTIDGAGGVLGQAAPCLEDQQGFPRVGYIEFDSADVAKMIDENTFDAVVVHEMMHIIGLGTYWEFLELVKGTESDPRYVGEFGATALNKINGDYMGTPAVENTGGEGTANSHWRESVFDDEMMTGFLSNTYQPVSEMTIQAFRDLGYSVDASATDEFVTPQVNLDRIPLGTAALSIGVIVGIAVAAIVGLAIISTVIMRIMRPRPSAARGGQVLGPSAMSSAMANAPQQPK